NRHDQEAAQDERRAREEPPRERLRHLGRSLMGTTDEFARFARSFPVMPVCPGLIVVDASSLAPTGATIDLIARQYLDARRRGGRIRLRGASVYLERLIRLAGLEDVLR